MTPILKQLTAWLQLTVAHYAAIAVGLLLVFCTSVTWFLLDSEPHRVAWSDYIQSRQLAGMALLACVICGLTYWTVRLWCEQTPIRDRSLEHAWKSGMRAVANRGIRIENVPVYLMLGCSDVQAQKSLLIQSGLHLAMEPVPVEASSMIRWYISEQCVVIGCNDIGLFAVTQNRLAVHQENLSSNSVAMQELAFTRSASVGEGESNVSIDESFETISRSTATEFEERCDNRANGNAGSRASTSVALLSSSKSEGTEHSEEVLLQIENAESLLRDLDKSEPCIQQETYPFVRINHATSQLLSSTEVIRYQTLLGDVCRRLRSARSGVSPINGSLVWVDTGQMLACSTYSRQCGFALRKDMDQLREELGVLAPVTVVMDRMHGLSGFTELVRRLGPERSKTMQLGEECDVQQTADPAYINSVCDRSLQSIVRSIYSVFRVDVASNAIGNQRLIQLLFACRGKLQLVLQRILSETFAVPLESKTPDESPILSGVFFTAAGEGPLEQGFTSHLMHRMSRQHCQLAWSSARMQLERNLNVTIWILRAVCVTLLGLVLYQFLMADIG